MPEPFSRRHQYVTASSKITVWEDAPEPLRVTLLETVRELELAPSFMRRIVCSILRVRPEAGNWSEFPNIWDEVQRLVYECEWFRVYDLIEAFHKCLEASGLHRYRQSAERFTTEINACCVENGIGWQLIDGQIIARGDNTFEQSVRTAQQELTEVGRATAASHIAQALHDLSARPHPDTSGSVSHATSAMECLLNDITHEHLTLGDFLKRNANLFPGSMKKALEGLWGYASNEGARHGREGLMPGREDAEFVVAIAAATVTFLNRKHPRP